MGALQQLHPAMHRQVLPDAEMGPGALPTGVLRYLGDGRELRRQAPQAGGGAEPAAAAGLARLPQFDRHVVQVPPCGRADYTRVVYLFPHVARAQRGHTVP